MNYRRFFTVFTSVVLAVFTSCSGTTAEPDPDPTPDPETPKKETLNVTYTPNPAEFEYTQGELDLVIEHSTSFNLKITGNWITKAAHTSSSDQIPVDKIKLTIAENTVKEARTGKIELTSKNCDAVVIDVKQAAAPSEKPLPEVIKILAIGNSFSADAVEQELYGLFAAEGQKVIIGDMYIGGCPLVTHAANAKSDAASYSYRKIVDGVLTTTSSVKLSTALKDEDWTFISVQEGAGYHGFYDKTYNGVTHSMEPDLTDLVNYIKEKGPKNCTLVYHAPWAAKTGYTGVKFSYYGYDQKVMYNMICEATQQVVQKHPEFGLVMNSMDAIQNARTTYLGDDFNRDGWHLSYTKGRYTVGCLWYEKIMRKSVVGNSYHPSTISDYVANVCQQAAHAAVEHPYTVTDLSSIADPGESTGDQTKRQILAKWYFTPARAKSDGAVMTWTGQEELGVYRYSNEPGERGYYNANEEGKGKLSYVQIDKTQWPGDNAGLSILNVSNGGQPVMCGPMPGDYWLFETTGAYEIPEGTAVHIIFTYNPGNYGAKYWMVEYQDGENWVPAFETSKTTISGQGEITYNMEFTSAQKIVEFTKTLATHTKEFRVRMTCCSTYQVNDKFFTSPNVKSASRIAGDPANEAKPLPQMDIVL